MQTESTNNTFIFDRNMILKANNQHHVSDINRSKNKKLAQYNNGRKVKCVESNLNVDN
jgi:hypothetical protein